MSARFTISLFLFAAALFDTVAPAAVAQGEPDIGPDTCGRDRQELSQW